ncbi:hypothetical protein [Dactylosporangium sp. CA-092794]|uniref:hypothetical protein n=1 Tax=Dactylosporangium sp. CA-092794 TaxID=3239929 RepID=UPI003D8ADB04
MNVHLTTRRVGAFLGPAGRDQTSGTPHPVPLPRGADDPAGGARLRQLSERLTGARLSGG